MDQGNTPQPPGLEAEAGLFATLVENSLVGVYLFQDGKMLYVNPTFERFLGRSAREISRSNIFEFIHPEDREMVMAKAQSRLEGRLEPEPYVFRILHSTGGVRWVVLLAERILYKGRPALLGNLLDVTELREAQQKSDEIRSLFEGLFEGMPDAIAILDQEGRVTKINPAFEALFGYSPEEALGRFMWDLIETQDRAGEGRENQKRVMAGQTVRMETQRRRKDGTILEVAVTGYPVRMGGKVHGIYAIYQDVTERKAAQRSLERAERRYRELVEQVPAGVYEVDVATARFLTVNDYMVRVFGYSREEFLSMTGYELWTDEGKEILRQRIQRILQDLPVPQVVEYPGRTKDGRAVWARIHSRFFIDEQGRHIARVVLLDVTEQRRLEQEFFQAQKMEAVGRLAGGVAHDINNALTSVLGYADLILSSTEPHDPFHESAREIKEGALRAASITSQLLAFSRKQLIRPQVVDLNEVVSNLARMLGPLIGEDITLQLALSGQPIWVRVDPTQMEQVILNLAINARDAMPKGGRLLLETSLVNLDESYGREHGISLTPGAYARLTVSDTGMGMDEETRQRIFEPFFTTKERGKGTGLGLSTVYGIVKQSGGYIWAYSEPGKGSTFKVYLPLEGQRTAVGEQVLKPAPGIPPTGTETVLVVEDSDQVRRLVKLTLERFGYRVLEASDAEAGLELLKSGDSKVDMLLTDVVLPGMAGPEMAKLAQERVPGLKVLYMSGYTGEFMAGRGALEPAPELMEKPFSPLALARKVREILDR